MTDQPIPTPESLGVDDPPYLNALAESASELRRQILDAVRRDDFERGEQLLARMDEIYAFLVTVDFPDGLTGGLRRTTDALRAVLERTRGDLTITGAQHRLLAALGQIEVTIPKLRTYPTDGASPFRDSGQQGHAAVDPVDQQIGRVEHDRHAFPRKQSQPTVLRLPETGAS